ncbi:hypothetical protein BGZ76_003500 [Entomortierella beljakovae]|nr:hypothetical protein BGZ76_003500 [Entomortierella beljakovae]
MSYSQQGAPTLVIYAHGAQNLQDVETLGKQDPYLQFTLDINNPQSFQKTFVHKDAGKAPVWNQTFTVPLAGEPELFVEIMDQEATVDSVVAFAAIPINQVVHAPGGTMNGIFSVYTPSGKPQGELNLTLTAHSVPGQNTQPISQPPQPVNGTSHINEAHQRRVKGTKNKEAAADVGTAALGGLLAVGAGLLVNKLVNDKKKDDNSRKESERASQLEREKFELERKRLDEERANFERQQAQFQQHQQFPPQHQQQYQPQHHQQQFQPPPPQYQGGGGGYSEDKKKKKKQYGSDSDSGSDSDDSHKKKGKKWDGHGRKYSPGDKVKFDGRKYVCLQAHNSQPDWAPTGAHSLWRAK